jgi:NADH:ubiquinone oxidoreductase subunit 6 (subunit J)
MTVLVGAAMLLVVASGIFLAVGFATVDQSFIWTSIAVTAAAAVLLIAAYARSRATDQATPSEAPEAPGRGSEGGSDAGSTPAEPAE